MNKFFKGLFISYLVFIFQINLKADNILKGETTSNIVSPLILLQKNDTTYFKRYLTAKKMFEEEDYVNSLKQSLVLISEIEKANKSELEYLSNLLIGDIFRKRNNHDKALLYFNKSLKLIENNPTFDLDKLSSYDELLQKEKTLAKTLLKIGSEYYKLNKKDSAAIYFKKIVEISSLNNFPKIKASGYTNLSAIYLERVNYTLARCC